MYTVNRIAYLEAIFIEYAIMEDRLEAILRHAGKWHPKEGQFVSLEAKTKKVADLAREKKNPAHRCFPPELTDRILTWKSDRNQLIHALLKRSLHSEGLLQVAEEETKLSNNCVVRQQLIAGHWNARIPKRRNKLLEVYA